MGQPETIGDIIRRYRRERANLLHHEDDYDVLWRVILAADHLADAVEPNHEAAEEK
jgi:hypothetical protein